MPKLSLPHNWSINFLVGVSRSDLKSISGGSLSIFTTFIVDCFPTSSKAVLPRAYIIVSLSSILKLPVYSFHAVSLPSFVTNLYSFL